MPETTWVDGDVATVAKLNQIEDQIIVTCTAGTRPTGVEGRRIFETDTNRELLYDGAAWVIMWSPWTAFTPSWTGFSIGDGTEVWKYRYAGGSLEIDGVTTMGSTSSVTSSMRFALPNGATTTAQGICALRLEDTGTTSNSVPGHGRVSGGTSLFLYRSEAGVANVGVSIPFTWAATDVIRLTASIPIY